MNPSLPEKLSSRIPGICLYGFAPPKQETPSDQLERIVDQQLARLGSLPVDGLIVYDIQDEAERVSTPRPFPFLPTLNPEIYAHEHLGRLAVPKIVYRSVNRDTHDGFVRWLQSVNAEPRISVLVGAPNRHSHIGLPLADAYALARQYAPNLILGGIAIAERHAHKADEHERILAKSERGCRFFVTQAVYDVAATKSLLSDYAIAVQRKNGVALPIILTFSPCGSLKTLSFMKWLGIAFPRWLENELQFAPDPLARSMELCERIFAEVWDYARDKGIPLARIFHALKFSRRQRRAMSLGRSFDRCGGALGWFSSDLGTRPLTPSNLCAGDSARLLHAELKAPQTLTKSSWCG